LMDAWSNFCATHARGVGANTKHGRRRQ
jgi:hypothetical protein